MEKIISMACFLICFGALQCKNVTTNSTDPNKDMYVIHAMVYQVGILTNKTDDKASNATTMGNQEALTIFRTNGSKVDLSSIPAPLMTNITAQSMVQVAPKPLAGTEQQNPQVTWSALKDLASLPPSTPTLKSGSQGLNIARRSNPDNAEVFSDTEYYDDESPRKSIYERSLSDLQELFKRETSDDKANVKVVKGAAVIPQGAGVQSVAIPPLISLNNNLSSIPVPIPNTSVVHYAKINTVIRKP